MYMLMIGWEDLNRIQGFLELPDKVMNQVIEELKERGIITRNTIH
jgi:predicted transcriptional regulator